MATILKARFGDETSMRDVTKLLNERISGTSIDLPVDNNLIPAFVGTPSTELTNTEKRRIDTIATEQCGGADQNCIEAKRNQLSQQALQIKLQSSNSPANIIKGTRLTVDIEKEDKSRDTVTIPAGQRFNFNGLLPINENGEIFTLDFFQRRFFEFLGTSVGAFIWVFGIVATYIYFSRKDQRILAIGLGLVAALIPGSGYIFVIVGAGLDAFVRYYTATE